MALVCGSCVALSLKDVAEMAAAVRADNLGARHAVGAVFVPGDGARDAIEVGRPAAARLELVRGLIQRRVTGGTGVNALIGEMLVVLPSEGPLRVLFPQDLELLCEEPSALRTASKGGLLHLRGDRTARHSSSDLLSG